MPRTLLLAAALVALAALPSRAGHLEDAEEAFQANRLKDALELVQRAVESSPDDATAVGLHGHVLYELGRFDEALPLLARAAELDPDAWANLVASLTCSVAFFRGQDEEVERLLKDLEARRLKGDDVTKTLPYLMAPDGLRRHKQKKGHYVIYVDDALERRKGHEWLGKMMELIYEAYSKVFPFPVDPKLVNRVYVFGDGEAYRRFNLRVGDDDGSDAVGYFDPTNRILVVDAEPQDGEQVNPAGLSNDAINTLFHEGFHQFMHLYVPQGAPMWFDEGLAEYFGPSTPSGKKSLNIGVVVKKDPARPTRYEHIADAVRGRAGMRSLRELLTRDFDGESFGVAEYAQAWSVIHFLLHAPGMGTKGKQLIKDYFFNLKEGGTAAQAFEASFAKADLGELEKAWKAYVLGL